MFVFYRCLRPISRIAAAREIDELGLEIGQVVEVLEEGFDWSSGRGRKPGVEEKCLRIGEKIVRAVVAEGTESYPEGGREDVFYLIHVSQETFKKRRWK